MYVLSAAALGLQQEIWVVVTETIGSIKPKIFTFWPFTEKVCCPCSKQLKENYSFYVFFTVLLYDITFHLWSLWDHFNLGQRSIFAFSRWLSSCPKTFTETARHSLSDLKGHLFHILHSLLVCPLLDSIVCPSDFQVTSYKMRANSLKNILI